MRQRRLGDGADEGEFERPEGCAEEVGGQAAGAASEDCGDGLAPELEHDAQLHLARREVGSGMVEDVTRDAAQPQERVFAKRHGDAGDGDDSERSHLEAGVEEARRRPQQQDEHCGSERVQRVAIAREQACE